MFNRSNPSGYRQALDRNAFKRFMSRDKLLRKSRAADQQMAQLKNRVREQEPLWFERVLYGLGIWFAKLPLPK